MLYKNTYEEKTVTGRENIEDTDPVNKVLYVLHAVKGT